MPVRGVHALRPRLKGRRRRLPRCAASCINEDTIAQAYSHTGEYHYRYQSLKQQARPRAAAAARRLPDSEQALENREALGVGRPQGGRQGGGK